MAFKIHRPKQFLSHSIAFIMAILIIFNMPLQAFGAQSEQNQDQAGQGAMVVSIGSVSGTVGEVIEVPVSIRQIPRGVASYGIKIKFTPNVIRVSGVIQKHGNPSDFWSNYDNKEGWIKVAWLDRSGGSHMISQDTQLFAIRLVITATGALGADALAIDTSNPDNFTFIDDTLSEVPKTAEVGRIQAKPEKAENSSAKGNTTAPADIKVEVAVNGVGNDSYAEAVVTNENGQTKIVVTLDENKISEKLEKEGNNTIIEIPVKGSADSITGQLNAQLVKAMGEKDASVKVSSDLGEYTLAAKQVNVDAISKQMGTGVALQDIKVHIEISKPSEETVKNLEKTSKASSYSVIVPATDFKVTATYEDKTVIVDRFNDYVERSLPIPPGVDISKITTGVVVEADGTAHHVPTKIIIGGDGKYYAVINSLTNSTYSVIYHPKAMSDVSSHWAKEAVNDMASRLIIKGTDENIFAPDKDITRAEFTSILVRALGIRSGTKDMAFKDAAPTAWYYDAVKVAVEYGIISGYTDNTFRPDQPITRQEAMAMLAKAAAVAKMSTQISENDIDAQLDKFADSSALGGWAAKAAAVCIKNGIIEGSSMKIAPKAPITRAETAAAVRRLLQKSGLI